MRWYKDGWVLDTKQAEFIKEFVKEYSFTNQNGERITYWQRANLYKTASGVYFSVGIRKSPRENYKCVIESAESVRFILKDKRG